jgi:myo-inositol-1(or 4)-monophosphatase
MSVSTADARGFSDSELDDLEAVAGQAAREGASVALEWFNGSRRPAVGEKTGPGDLVSEADLDAERAIRAVIDRLRPADGVLGEELLPVEGTSGVRWVVDPIDGTTSFVYGRADWAVSVAALREADDLILAGAVVEPVLGVVTTARDGGGTRAGGHRVECAAATDLSRALVELNLGRPEQRATGTELVSALVPLVRDVRRSGSAAAALAQVARGQADAYWGPGLQPWDAAAGLLLAREAGASTGDLAGTTKRWPQRGDILAAAPVLWPELRRLIASIFDA